MAAGLINGHFTGHLLSALAFAAAGSDEAHGGAEMAAKGDALVAGIAECQAAVPRRGIAAAAGGRGSRDSAT